MACKECKEPKNIKLRDAKYAWSVLPEFDLDKIPDDLEVICGSNSVEGSWRIPLSRLIDEVKKEIENGK